MQNQTVKTIGRRPVYPVDPTSAERTSLSRRDNENLPIEKMAQARKTRHTITVLGRLSSCLSDK